MNRPVGVGGGPGLCQGEHPDVRAVHGMRNGNFELMECTPAGQILLHRKQRLQLRVPVPQDLETLPAAVEAALRAYGSGRLALKKQYAPVNWGWQDTSGQVVHL
ncbi:hypothetical protein AB0L16_17485 [Streptomyces orinoci]|uniref:Uncharacterized protein n=1 Tax=Streptomyces orinoci TaxID=67339 RepID=A0ABV3JZR3_STRON|nr:hypothetical protein [Streptomyces orinoci]